MYLQHFTVNGIHFATFYVLYVTPEGRIPDMVAYEFYSPDETGKERLIGILPERRKNPKRINTKSILNWVKKILGNEGDMKNIYFTKVDV
jgi:hypothetical protein